MTRAKAGLDVELYVDDPIYPPHRAAREYLGIEPRTLRDVAKKYHLKRSPMPGTGLKFGYRRSELNRLLRELEQRFGAFDPAAHGVELLDEPDGASAGLDESVHSPVES